MKIISLRENPEYLEKMLEYVKKAWPTVPGEIYDDCMRHSISASGPLPQWYLLEDNGKAAGCVGLVTNDFISRMDLYPWICALYVEETHRGNYYSELLVDRASEDARRAGFKNVYLTTDHVGLYEKYDFVGIGYGYDVSGEKTRIYRKSLAERDFVIREAAKEDLAGIYDLIKKAFETAKVKDGTEQDFAVSLREGSGYVPELELVAEMDGKLIGHAMLTETFVINNGKKRGALLFAPLSVVIERRNSGVGATLVQESLRRARRMGYDSVFLCGDPEYYGRFGFREMSFFGIQSSTDIPGQYCLVYELKKGALENSGGVLEAF